MSLHRPCAALLAIASLAVAGFAQAQAPKPENVLKYRQSVYTAIAWNFGPMGAMAQGRAPFDARAFQMRAERVAALAPMVAESFTPETRGLANSKLKPAMWDNRADFDAKLKEFVEASSALAAAARTGDEAKSKEAFFATANTCKACHDRYKAD
jgi:cytochrome c556